MRNGNGHPAPGGRNRSDGGHEQPSAFARRSDQPWHLPRLLGNGEPSAASPSTACTELVISDALAVALAATHLTITWHAGALSAEAAMRTLHDVVDQRGRPSAAASLQVPKALGSTRERDGKDSNAGRPGDTAS